MYKVEVHLYSPCVKCPLRMSGTIPLQPFVVPLRILMLLGGGLIVIFGSEHLGLGGAGPLGVIAAAFVSSYSWSKQGWDIDDVSI